MPTDITDFHIQASVKSSRTRGRTWPRRLCSAESEGPQYIEAAGTFVVTPVEPEASQDEVRLPLGQWLIENAPRGANLVAPDDAVL